MAQRPSSPVGKDIIYVCQHCGNREKEFAFSDRNYKYCNRCSGPSVKSTLTDSYNYVSSNFTEAHSEFGDNSYE